MLGHLLQNPKDQGPTVFGCGSATSFILRIPDIWVNSSMAEFVLADDPIPDAEMLHNMGL
jgi:hypothetical protein